MIGLGDDGVLGPNVALDGPADDTADNLYKTCVFAHLTVSLSDKINYQ